MYSIGPLPSVAVTKVFFLLLIPYAVEVDRARYETAVVQYLLSSLMDQIRSGEYSLLTCGSSGFEDVIGKSCRLLPGRALLIPSLPWIYSGLCPAVVFCHSILQVESYFSSALVCSGLFPDYSYINTRIKSLHQCVAIFGILIMISPADIISAHCRKGVDR